MIRYTFVSDRKLANCAGSDRYVEVNSVPILQDLVTMIDQGKIKLINGKEVIASYIPNKEPREFQIRDAFSGILYPAKISNNDRKNPNDGKITRKRWLRSQDYTDAINLTPEQIMRIYIEEKNNDYLISIRAFQYYKYIFKRVSGHIGIYVLESSSCAEYQKPLYLDEYLKKFNIINTKQIYGRLGYNEYDGYRIEGSRTEFVGIPFSTKLKITNFEKEDIHE